jgi:hypothetical protein
MRSVTFEVGYSALVMDVRKSGHGDSTHNMTAILASRCEGNTGEPPNSRPNRRLALQAGRGRERGLVHETSEREGTCWCAGTIVRGGLQRKSAIFDEHQERDGRAVFNTFMAVQWSSCRGPIRRCRMKVECQNAQLITFILQRVASTTCMYHE